ncbi:unnamed protein product [Tuber aestivum]|uniref:Uncharacterized protein n=1 Tax=Tuber aestivum TaxID=59557 RepID=A0A292PWL5_9PEZI|nr:unnamed protein product [Tuber aestivum]
MSTPDGSVAQFFSRFNFQKYTYNPHAPALEEFKRLCESRLWGLSKIRRHEAEFLLILEEEQDSKGRSAGPEVIEFFRKYEYHLFTYDLDVPAQQEFQRLVELRGWGKKKLSKVKKEFKNALLLDAEEQSVSAASEPTGPRNWDIQEVDLLADWLREQQCPGYRYRGGLPELEFKKLESVKRWEWLEYRHHEIGRDLTVEERREWKRSPEFESLRAEFYTVVEEVFNLILDDFCQITGLTPWEVLAGLYGKGQDPAGRNAARKIWFQILSRVFINIFDFLDVFKEILRNPPTTNRQELFRLLKPRATELQFPNNLMLGVYSALTNRVFPKELARQGGTLALLLHNIMLYLVGFDYVMREFENEAGDELKTAEEEGRVGVRRLLLSRKWSSLEPLKSNLRSVPV